MKAESIPEGIDDSDVSFPVITITQIRVITPDNITGASQRRYSEGLRGTIPFLKMPGRAGRLPGRQFPGLGCDRGMTLGPFGDPDSLNRLRRCKTAYNWLASRKSGNQQKVSRKREFNLPVSQPSWAGNLCRRSGLLLQ